MYRVTKDFSNRKQGDLINPPVWAANRLILKGCLEKVEDKPAEKAQPEKVEDKPKRGRKAK